MKNKRQLLATAVLALLAGCAHFDDLESRAAMRQPADLAAETSLPGKGGRWPDLAWAGEIGGAPLQSLIDEALATNPTLQIAEARIGAAQSVEQLARAASNVGIGAKYSSTWQRFTEHGLIPPPLAGHYYSDNEIALNFSYDFDFWHKQDALLRAALAQGQAAQAEQYAARLMLSTAVARSWVQLARQQGQLDLVQQQLDTRQKIDGLTKLRYRAGLETQTDNEQSKQQIAVLRAELAQWREAMGLTRNQLAALLGQGPDRGLRIAAGTLQKESVQENALPDALPAGLLGRRPDVVAARWRVEAAQGDVDATKALFYPEVDLLGFAGFSSLGLPDLLKAGSRVVGIGPSIRLPIFQKQTLRGQFSGKVAAYDAAVGSYNQALTEALHDVADQVQSLRGAHEQDEQIRGAVAAASSNLQLARQREQVGTSNMLPVLAAEMTLLSQRKTALDLQARLSDLHVGLIKALGGGYRSAAPAATPSSVTTTSAATQATGAAAAAHTQS